MHVTKTISMILILALFAEVACADERYELMNFSPEYGICMAKVPADHTFAQHEIICLQQELEAADLLINITYSELAGIMKSNKWQERLKNIQSLHSKFESFRAQASESVFGLYGSRMAGSEMLIEKIEYSRLYHLHLKRLLDYYKS